MAPSVYTLSMEDEMKNAMTNTWGCNVYDCSHCWANRPEPLNGAQACPNTGLQVLGVAIAYAAWLRLSPTLMDDGYYEAAGFDWPGTEIHDSMRVLGCRDGAPYYPQRLVGEWARLGGRMGVRTVRTDFGRLLGQPDRVDVDWTVWVDEPVESTP